MTKRALLLLAAGAGLMGFVCWASVHEARIKSDPGYIKQERERKEQQHKLEQDEAETKKRYDEIDRKRQESKEHQAEAVYAVRDLVLSRLKAPSTARFGDWSETAITDAGKDTYVVSSYVDSQNSFGAMLRNRYICKLKLTADRQHWQVIRFSMGQ